MIRASERRIRAIRTAEVTEEDAAAEGGREVGEGGVEAWEEAKAMKSGRKCMNC